MACTCRGRLRPTSQGRDGGAGEGIAGSTDTIARVERLMGVKLFVTPLSPSLAGGGIFHPIYRTFPTLGGHGGIAQEGVSPHPQILKPKKSAGLAVGNLAASTLQQLAILR